MSYIRLTEQRRYFDGESNLYVYPVADSGKNIIQFQGDLNGTVKSEDFWELIIRALERTDLDEDSFWDAELAIQNYYEKEQGMTEDLREEIENE